MGATRTLGELNMNVDGIWYIEIFGLYGWESIGVLLLSHGNVMGGGDNHYSVGSYTLSKDSITISMSLNYKKEKMRTLFGESRKEFEIVFQGTQNGKKRRYQGLIHRPNKAEMSVVCRIRKEADPPWSLQ